MFKKTPNYQQYKNVKKAYFSIYGKKRILIVNNSIINGCDPHFLPIAHLF